MKEILVIGPNKDNAGDGVIFDGIKNLLGLPYDYFVLDDHNSQDYIKTKEYDEIVIAGTPWLWNNFQHSHKYINLHNVLKIHRDTKTIFMGIGACLNLTPEISSALETPEEIKGMKDLFENAEVIVRDHLAKEKLDKVGIKNEYKKCPSYYAKYFDIGENKENILFYHEPLLSISYQWWGENNQKLEEYYEICKIFYKKYNPKVYLIYDKEKEAAEKLGFNVEKTIRSSQEVGEILKTANKVLSGRVHCAVPALAHGKQVGLLPIDTRCYTFSDFGGKLINNVKDLEWYELL